MCKKQDIRVYVVAETARFGAFSLLGKRGKKSLCINFEKNLKNDV